MLEIPVGKSKVKFTASRDGKQLVLDGPQFVILPIMEAMTELAGECELVQCGKNARISIPWDRLVEMDN